MREDGELYGRYGKVSGDAEEVRKEAEASVATTDDLGDDRLEEGFVVGWQKKALEEHFEENDCRGDDAEYRLPISKKEGKKKQEWSFVSEYR